MKFLKQGDKMMFFNNKLVAIVLLAGVFCQISAMKRNFDSNDKGNSHKRLRIELSTPKFVIPSGWHPSEVLPTKTLEVADKGKKNKEQKLTISLQQQSKFHDRIVSPYHDQKLCSSLNRFEIDQANYHMQKLTKLHCTTDIVSAIVSSEISFQEKTRLLDQLQKDTKDQSQEAIFNQLNEIRHTPLRAAVAYDDYQLAHDLLNRKADPNKRDASGRTIAFDAQSVEMLRLLQAFGATPLEDRDSLGKTLLHENASRDIKDLEIATWYIANGGSVEQKNVYGQTAQQWQAMYGGENPDLLNAESANAMTRKYSGLNNPHVLRAIQTGQLPRY